MIILKDDIIKANYVLGGNFECKCWCWQFYHSAYYNLYNFLVMRVVACYIEFIEPCFKNCQNVNKMVNLTILIIF